MAPCDANTLAKIANGICDNLVTCIIRAWDCGKPLLVFPAMNTYMWTHPITEKHIQIISALPGHQVFNPVEKKLACGDFGMGALAPVEQIVEAIMQHARRKK